MPYALGARSVANMDGMLPALADTIKLAITLSKVDFGITERQVRTLEYQRTLVARGVSQTLKSNHLVQSDGYGHACDLVPWIDGKFVWDWSALYEVGAAMVRAGYQLGHADRLCWGGCWDRWAAQYAPSDATAAHLRKAEADYCIRHPGKDFVDGPHFQYGKLG